MSPLTSPIPLGLFFYSKPWDKLQESVNLAMHLSFESDPLCSLPPFPDERAKQKRLAVLKTEFGNSLLLLCVHCTLEGYGCNVLRMYVGRYLHTGCISLCRVLCIICMYVISHQTQSLEVCVYMCILYAIE